MLSARSSWAWSPRERGRPAQWEPTNGRFTVLRRTLMMVCLLAVIGCGGAGVEVTEKEYGDDWPLTVESAELRCEEPSVVIAEADGTTYALNGAAQQEGYPPVDPIWRDDPEAPEGVDMKVSLRPLNDRGLELCEG